MNSNNISFSTEKYLMFTTCFSKSKSSRDILIDLLKKENINTQLLTDVNQIHSDKVLVVHKPGNHGDADGLITSGDKNLILFIKTADCVPIFIYDDVSDILFLELYLSILYLIHRMDNFLQKYL